MIHFGSGTYNLRATEGFNPEQVRPRPAQQLICTVFFLDNSEKQFFLSRNALGDELLAKVFDHLELVEKDFFGLQFISALDSNATRMRWLDAKKSVKRQMLCPPYHLFFRVKFYVSDPSKLIEEYTRYHVYLQLRKDLLDGKLPCPDETAVLLGSYAAQSEFGDYCLEEHGENYLEGFALLPIQSPTLIRRVAELHRRHCGQTPADAEYNFLQCAKTLDHYGFDFYDAKDGGDRSITVGVNGCGITVFQNTVRVNSFPWSAIVKLSFKRKNFLVQMKTIGENDEPVDTELCFNALSPQNCKMMWKSCIEHHSFFRLIAPPVTPVKSLFHLGSRFRYSGRTEYQTMEEMRQKALVSKVFQRQGGMSRRSSFRTATITEAASNGSSSSGEEKWDRIPTATHSTLTSNSTSNSGGSVYEFASRMSRRLIPRTNANAMLRESVLRRRLTELNGSARMASPSLPALLQNLFSLKSSRISRYMPPASLDEQSPEEEVEIDLESQCETDAVQSYPNGSLRRSAKTKACPPPAPSPSSSKSSSSAVAHSAVPLRIRQPNGTATLTRAGVALSHQNGEKETSIVGSDLEQADSGATPSLNTSLCRTPSPYDSAVATTSSRGSFSASEEENTRSSASTVIHNGSGPHSKANDYGLRELSISQISNGPLGSPNNHHRNGRPQSSPRQDFTALTTSDSAMTLKGPVQSAKISPVVHAIPVTTSGRYPSATNNPLLRYAERPKATEALDVPPAQNGFVVSSAPNGRRVLHRHSLHGNALANGHNGGEFSVISGKNGAITVVNGSANSPVRHTSAAVTNGSVTDRPSVTHHSSGHSAFKTSPRLVQSQAMNGTPPIPNGSVKSPRTTYSAYGNVPTTNGHGHASSARVHRSPTRQPSTSPQGSVNSEESYVIVRMSPDSQGRFGFNITGGSDAPTPVIISRVIVGSSADRCYPRLNEGDQVLKINGQDISQWTNKEVTTYIRTVREKGEITLTVRPNVYRCGELDSENSENQFIVPETLHVSETVPRSDKLAQSLLLLKEALDTGKIVQQFEQLYRKNPGLKMGDSQRPENLNKNRYRDVCPYDSSRVILKRSPSGDYINASHVNMEIRGSGIVNRYIATQGPLAHTTGDFWYMCWEQSVNTIAMLTTIVEKGRVKCHQYWPKHGESFEYGQLQITTMSERSEEHCHYREFAIRHKTTREERRITQMQYTAWPDHGVPANGKHFIDFVSEVRRARNGSLDPVIVHCSAGIGRTGVLILMETAACLIEANEPVYPLDIVRTMRDQRAMMIQTTDQYKFVCEAVLRAYSEGTIKPLAEYQTCR